MKKLIFSAVIWASVAGFAVSANNPTDWKVSYDSVMNHYNSGRTDQAYAELSRLGLSGAEKDRAWEAIKGGTTWGNSTEFDNWMNTPTPKPEPSRPDWFPVLEKQFQESQAAQDAVIDTKAGKDELAAVVDNQKATDSKQDKALTDAVAKQSARDAQQDKAINGKVDVNTQTLVDQKQDENFNKFAELQKAQDDKQNRLIDGKVNTKDQTVRDAQQDQALADAVTAQGAVNSDHQAQIDGKVDQTTFDDQKHQQGLIDASQDTLIAGKADKVALDTAVVNQKKKDAEQDVKISDNTTAIAGHESWLNRHEEQILQSNQTRDEQDLAVYEAGMVYTDQAVTEEAFNRENGDAKTLLSAKQHTASQVADEAKKRQSGDDKVLQTATTHTNTQVGYEREARIAGDAATLRSANEYTNNKFNQLNKMVNENRDEARAGIAGALAAGQIPQVSQGRDFSVGAGVGTYRGESAIAVGVSGRLDARTVTKFAVSADTQSGIGAGAGISYEW